MSYNDRLRIKQQEFTYNLALLIQRVHFLGCRASMGHCFRTESQQWLYKNGKKIVDGKIVDRDLDGDGKGDPVSWTMNSQHLKKLAVDLNLFIPDGRGGFMLSYASDYHEKLGNYWESLNSENKWAVTKNDGSKIDQGHFEMKG